MKKVVLKIALLTFVVAILAAVPTFAQQTIKYHANVPFSFNAGGTNMAAGDYKIGMLDTGSATGPLIIQTRQGDVFKVLALIHRGPDLGLRGGKLVFIKTGDQYALARVETPLYSWKDTKTIANGNELAANKSKPEMVEVNFVAKN
jgi:hypothetical protein